MHGRSYGFEAASDQGWDLASSGPLPVAFNNGTNGTGSQLINALLSGVGQVLGTAQQGRFGTTLGGRGHYLAVSTGSAFTASFDTAIAAFGFYGTDVGDFDGTLTAYLRHAGSAEEDSFIVRRRQPASSGALLFWGFASLNASYDQIVSWPPRRTTSISRLR